MTTTLADSGPVPTVDRVTPTRRAWLRTLAVAFVLLAAAIALPRFLTHTPYPRLGVVLDNGFGMGRPSRVQQIVGPPAQGVLEKGDLLVRVDGRNPADSTWREAVRDSGGLPKRPIELVIERGGARRTIMLPSLQLGAWQRMRLYIFPVLAIIAAPLVALLLVWRRPDLGAAWTFLWFACMQGIGTVWSLFRFSQVERTPAFSAYLTGLDMLVWFYPASFLHFMVVFPRSRWKGRQRVRSVWFWLTVAAYVVPLVAVPWFKTTKASWDVFYLSYQTIVVALGIVSLLERYARQPSGDWHPGTGERVLALVLAVSMFLAALLSAIAEAPIMTMLLPLLVVRVLFFIITSMWLISPVLIAFLIANDPAFDPRRIIVRSSPYALLSGVLATLYLGLVLLSQRLFAAATGEEALVFNVVAALIVAFAFAPLRERLQRGIDRIFGRDPAALRRALDRAGHELLGALDRAEVRASVERGIREGLKRDVTIEWPETGAPGIGAGEELDDEARSGIQTLLMQAGVRLENLALQDERLKAERSAAELREAATRAELRALHAQVQPHFLFNALNALSYLTETDPRAAQRFTERLADMLRYTVEAGARPAALLSEEIAFVEDYLGVARERYENPLHFEYRGPRELLSITVPPLLLQPLVENSLKHGCGPGQDALHLTLEAQRESDWLTMEFADDGSGRGNGAPGLGVGLDNLAQRLRRFAGPDARVDAGPGDQGGYRVRLKWRMTRGLAA